MQPHKVIEQATKRTMKGVAKWQKSREKLKDRTTKRLVRKLLKRVKRASKKGQDKAYFDVSEFNNQWCKKLSGDETQLVWSAVISKLQDHYCFRITQTSCSRRFTIHWMKEDNNVLQPK